MIDSPIWLQSLFYLSTIVCFLLLFRSISFRDKTDNEGTGAYTFLYAAAAIILIFTGGLAIQKFFLVYNTVPPRFIFAVGPALLTIVICFLLFRKQLLKLSISHLVLLHSCRLLVEFGLYGLAEQKLIPVDMTFEGRNWDILMGISAPFIYWAYSIKKIMPRELFLAWNFMGLFLLINVVSTGVMTTPYFVGASMEIPNTGLLYFPYIWLPAFIVPSVLFAHLVTIFSTVKTNKEDGTHTE